MALWSGRTRAEGPDPVSFRAEVQSAVEAMVTHRLKEAAEHLTQAMAQVQAMPLSAVHKYAVTNHLLDAANKLTGRKA
jgi:elongation factor P hydroxylase